MSDIQLSANISLEKDGHGDEGHPSHLHILRAMWKPFYDFP